MEILNKVFLNSVDGEKKNWIAPLLYAGIAKYSDKDYSKVLINKYIDDIAKSFVGTPIVEGHIQPSSENDPNILGRVEEVFCNGEGFILTDGTQIQADGKYYCKFQTFDQRGEDAVKRNGFISTSYVADEVIEAENGEKLEYINNPYDVEIKSVKARHVALVSKPRYEDAVIFENNKENIMEVESKIEIEKGVFVSFLSSAAEKGRELISNVFENSKKKNNMSDEEAKADLKKLEKHEEEEIKEEKENSKKKDNSEEKEEAKENSEEEDKKENSGEEMDNGVDVEGEKVSLDELKNCWKNSKKSNSKIKENSKEEISLEEIEAKSFENSADKKQFKIGAGELGFNNFFNSK